MAHNYKTSYTVSYDSESHWSVLTQMNGSIWLKVLPYCLFNVFLMVVLIVVDRHTEQNIKIEMSAAGHSFVSLVVAFLLVSRVNIGLGRYNEARQSLSVMFRESRDLIQNCCVYSKHDASATAKEWRSEVAYRCLILLRTTMAVIDYPVRFVPAWKVPELTGTEQADVTASVLTTAEMRKYAHCQRSEWEETMRVPIRLAYLLRKAVHSQDEQKRVRPAVVPFQELRLLSNTDRYMNGYYSIRKFLTTPVPFPLIQMARTFLFLYVFTVPFVLLSDSSSDVAHCFTVFLLTYGFVGLEYAAIELDNPFGDDPNDFDNAALAAVAYEDAYLTLGNLDGPDWERKLRRRMNSAAAAVAAAAPAAPSAAPAAKTGGGGFGTNAVTAEAAAAAAATAAASSSLNNNNNNNNAASSVSPAAAV